MVRFTEMPVDVLQNIIEYLPPETLSTLRVASPGMREMVDTWVGKLVETGELQDPEGNDLRYLEYSYEPSEILENWANHGFSRSVAPLSEAEVAARAESFDVILTPDVSYEEDPDAFNEWVQGRLGDYAEILAQGGTGAEGLDAALYSYFQSLIRAGRLVDAATDNPLPTSTSSSKVMELLRNGQARWIAP
jgi:F-box domain